MPKLSWFERGENIVSVPVGSSVIYGYAHGVTGRVVDKTKQPVTTYRGRDYEPIARYYGSLVKWPGGDINGQWISDADLSVVDDAAEGCCSDWRTCPNR